MATRHTEQWGQFMVDLGYLENHFLSRLPGSVRIYDSPDGKEYEKPKPVIIEIEMGGVITHRGTGTVQLSPKLYKLGAMEDYLSAEGIKAMGITALKALLQRIAEDHNTTEASR